eukprot:TRINITY_DN20845_c0_g1_i1.p1 TRINITY_DN20845_c0_g1~~TRINITY_DN20845_c0_g1_i1.p1  ORF type:complete len:535 (-),score=98.59 TRINITY_DN20845_c0_g1_i1:86-1690(-)
MAGYQLMSLRVAIIALICSCSCATKLRSGSAKSSSASEEPQLTLNIANTSNSEVASPTIADIAAHHTITAQKEDSLLSTTTTTTVQPVKAAPKEITTTVQPVKAAPKEIQNHTVKVAKGKLETEYTVRLNNHLNVQYSGDFSIGGQAIPVIYDTGSFEVLVLSTRCLACNKHLQMYNDKNSSTFKPGLKSAEHTFVSGKVVTDEGYDDLRLGRSDSPVVAKAMTIWMVKSHTLAFWETGNAIFSGIIGLSHVDRIPEGYSGDKDDNRYLLSQMGLDSFTLCLSRGATYGPGYLTFGKSITTLKKQHPGAFQTVDVSGDSHWAAKLAGFKVSGTGAPDSSSLCKPSCGALIDSGTSLLTLPRSASALKDWLIQAVKPDCSNLASLPVLTFELDGAKVELPPKAYVFKTRSAAGVKCRGAFMQVDKESQFGETFILGMPFLRYYLTVFDRKNKQMHIARSTDNCKVLDHSGFVALPHANLHEQATGKDNHIIQTLGEGSLNGAGESKYGSFSSADFTEATEGDLDQALVSLTTARK